MPHNTNIFQAMTDYQEAQQGHGPVYFGRRQHVNAPTRPLGSALYPERRGEQWDYEKNKAFFAGAINAQRSFILVSDIETETGALQNGYTCDEIRWLQDVGYTFTPDPNNIRQTVAQPPAVFHQQPSIRDYNKHYGTETDPLQVKIQRFQMVKNDILQQRQTLQQQVHP